MLSRSSTRKKLMAYLNALSTEKHSKDLKLPMSYTALAQYLSVRSQCDDKRTEESRNGRNHREKRKANPYKLTYSELVEYTEHNLFYGERQVDQIYCGGWGK